MKNSRYFLIGLMVIVGLAFLVFGVNYLKGINIFTPTHHYSATYERIDGLVKSAPVTINGHKVGLVHEITYDFTQPRPFNVTISLDDDIRIPEGSILELADDGLIGSKCARIILNREGLNFLTPGDTLPGQMARGMFDDIQSETLPTINNRLLPHADSLMIALRILVENESLEKSLKSIEVMTKNLEESSARLKSLVNNEFPHLLANVDTLSANLVVTTDNLKDVDFAATIDSLDSTINGLKSITEKLNSTDGSLGLLLNDDSLYINVNQTIQSAEALLTDFKEHPKRYINVSVFGGKTKDQSKNKN